MLIYELSSDTEWKHISILQLNKKGKLKLKNK